MDRRSSIKALLALSVSVAVLPSCLQQERRASVSLKNLTISADDEDLITAVSDTIIPQGKTPGAKDVRASEFALMMIDDCYSPKDQKQFIKGLKEFDEAAVSKLNKSFSKASLAERTAFLKSIETNNGNSNELSFFYNSTRWLTLRAFQQSKYYLTEVQKYKLVPGKFYGCVPVKKAS